MNEKATRKMPFDSDVESTAPARKSVAVLGKSAAGVQILKPAGKPSFSLAKLRRAIQAATPDQAGSHG